MQAETNRCLVETLRSSPNAGTTGTSREPEVLEARSLWTTQVSLRADEGNMVLPEHREVLETFLKRRSPQFAAVEPPLDLATHKIKVSDDQEHIASPPETDCDLYLTVIDIHVGQVKSGRIN
uniref:SFRICE_022268 n=1 Tax=Spodoptera frugiperda TaxID=7108 RepID=A0A2H1VUR9_SPOFR